MVIHLVDQEIIHSLDLFHSQFFSSLGGDSSALATFLTAWTSFASTIDSCCDDLREETRQRVYNFSITVASVIEGVLKTQPIHDEICAEVSSILDSVAPNSFESPYASPANSPLQAPYIKMALQWLVTNIHDPYPSPKVRTAMAEKHNSSRKDVDNWFLDARKRIGWNDLRRKHFDNKRGEVVDAAKRFFLDTNPSRPLPQAVESEFASIQIRVNELYSAKFEESRLAIQLDRSIIDLTPGIKASAGATKSHKARTSCATKAARNYPTPQPSPVGASSLALSPTPFLPGLPSNTSKRRTSPLSEFEDEDKRPSKRRKTSNVVGEASLTSSPTPSFSKCTPPTSKGTAAVLAEFDERAKRPLNGRRSFTLVRETSPSLQNQRTLTFASPQASLPSPVESTFDASELHPPPHYTDSNATSALKRKHRPSDSGEGLPDSKRLQTSSITSRPHAAPDPSPITQHAIAGGFQWDQLLDFSQLPPPVSDMANAEITGPVNVSLFDFSAWDDREYDTITLSQGSLASSSNTVDTDVTGGFAAQSTDLLAHDNILFDWNPYGSSYCPTQQSPTSGNGFFDLNSVPCDFTSLGNSLTIPISLSTSYGCLPTFSLPLQPTLQNLPQPAGEAIRTIPQSALKAKEEQLHALQAQVAALAAEIAAAS